MMTTEELLEMRVKILPQLQCVIYSFVLSQHTHNDISCSIAFGEMSHARDLLNLLTAPSQPPAASPETSQTLSATIVSKLPPIPSVQAFNAQLSIAGKDEALRKAANSFKLAAESTERGRLIGERYWVDALKTRRGNWGLIPAPLPPGSSTAKGADKSSKDFLISFGLEECPLASFMAVKCCSNSSPLQPLQSLSNER
jgi:mediator of RNA polymerase II transcription subunit 17, fungi type